MTHLKVWLGVLLFLSTSAMARVPQDKIFSIKAKAVTKADRDRVTSAGVAIDAVFSDSVGFIGTNREIAKLKKMGIELEVMELPEKRWGAPGFPLKDSAYHDYKEMQDALTEIVTQHPNIATKFSIGKSLEGRDLTGVRISGNPVADSLPTVLFMGCHHAREHLSVEVPLKIAQYLVSQYDSNSRVKNLVDTREIWVVPMVNPDGAEFDISTGDYGMWRKNRRNNGDGSMGVDLNRNYGKGFGGPGSSSAGYSDIYHGPSAFSEPETLDVKNFVDQRKKTTMLLSFHTFSELVLWPWGNTDDEIPSDTDRKVFETMGKKMADWNHYTPQKSSELYLASGDTTDWAYDAHKIFAFTFELTPTSMFEGGFYPGAKAIEPTFQANLEPVLYMIDLAENPYRAVE